MKTMQLEYKFDFDDIKNLIYVNEKWVYVN